MKCFGGTNLTAHTAEGVVKDVIAVQQALNVLSTIQFWAYLNPFTGCAKNNSSYDFIIAGGGTSGCVLANRLSEDPNISVLLIEAGDNFQLDTILGSMLLYTRGSRIDWNFTVESNTPNRSPQSYFTLAGKVLGGTSSVDQMIHSQGFDSDYDEWATLTNEPAWEYANVQRLFKRIERFKDTDIRNSQHRDYHGFCGKISLTKDKGPIVDKYLKAFEEVGHNIVLDINNGNKVGCTGTVYYIDDMRQNTAYAYLFPIRDRPNLVVLKKTQVVKIIFDKDKRAIGVEAVDTETGKTFVFRCKQEVIITAGTYNTAKLLQLSGVGPKTILDNFGIDVISDIPVGHNFHNHVVVPVLFAGEETSKRYVLEKMYTKEFPSYTLDGFVSLDKNKLTPDYRIISYIVPYTPATLLLQYTSAMYRYDSNVTNYWYQNIRNRETIFTFIHGLKPESRGIVKIRSSDPFDPPIIEGNFMANLTDLKNNIEYVKHFLQLRESDFIKNVGGYFVDPMKETCGDYDYESDEYWSCYIEHLMNPYMHQCGTAAMSTVVDGRLRVYGVHRLRVADASVMPTIISGSTTIPSMMIGENAAEMIKQDYCRR